MNYTESFDQFASKLSGTDIALYAGAGLILWILFKDKLSPVQKFLVDTVGGLKSKLNNGVVVPVVVPDVAPVAVSKETKEDNFFKLVVSWKQTRDLAIKSGCDEAVKVAAQMFPFLSPTVCSKEKIV
jgi:hypothetical protein